MHYLNQYYGNPPYGSGFPNPYMQAQPGPYPFPQYPQHPQGFPIGNYNAVMPYGGYPPQNVPYSNAYPSSKPQLFQNPLQSGPEHPFAMKFQGGVPGGQYPKPGAIKPPGNSILQSFKSQDGSLDLSKMVNTAGQMVSALNQVGSMAKGLTSIFKV